MKLHIFVFSTLNRNTNLCIIALFLSVSLITQAESTTILENKSSQLENTTTNEVVEWQIYKDNEDGYTIQYPIEWKVLEPESSSTGKDFTVTTDKYPSKDFEDTRVTVAIKDVSRTLDPTTLKVRSTSLDHHANILISALTSPDGQPNILKNEAINFNGEQAWRVDYIWNLFGRQVDYGSSIFVEKADKLFEIHFSTDPLKVEEMRPVGEKIMQSFQFFNNTGQELEQHEEQKAENLLGQSGKTKALEGNSASNSDCEESYPDVCITSGMTCSDVNDRNFEVTGSDPNNFDLDGDGLGCEED